MSVSSSVIILNVIIAEVANKSMLLPISISNNQTCGRTVETKALLNTGAGEKFIDQNFVWQNKLVTRKLEKPIMVYNMDGTKNKKGTIVKCVDVNLQIGDRKIPTELMVTGLGQQKIILRFLWFEEQNPEINWEKGLINWQTKEIQTPATYTEVLDEEEYLNRTQNPLHR